MVSHKAHNLETAVRIGSPQPEKAESLVSERRQGFLLFVWGGACLPQAGVTLRPPPLFLPECAEAGSLDKSEFLENNFV